MSRKPADESTRPSHAALAVVLQVRDGVLQVLLWQRARPPFEGSWALPGGLLAPSETLEESIRRHLAAKVDVQELAHLAPTMRTLWRELEQADGDTPHPAVRRVAS